MTAQEQENLRCVKLTLAEILKMEKQLDDYDKKEAKRLQLQYIKTNDLVSYGKNLENVENEALMSLFRNTQRLYNKEWPYSCDSEYMKIKNTFNNN